MIHLAYLAYAVLSVVIACVIHELGHYIAALVLGGEPRVVVKFPPVVTWTNGTDFTNKVIAIMGFSFEILPEAVLVAFNMRDAALIYLAVYTAHFLTYPFRMSGKVENDFRYLS